MFFELEGKLEFPSYLPLSLVSQWIGDGRLGSIYTYSSHAYCYECWAIGHIPTRARTRRTELGRAGPGRVRVARAHDLWTRMQFDSGACWTCYIFLGFYFLFFYLKFCWDCRIELDSFKRIRSARYNHSRMITDSLRLLQTERSAEGINTIYLHVSFTRNRNQSALFLP